MTNRKLQLLNVYSGFYFYSRLINARHVARMGEVCSGCWWGSLRERGHWGDQDIDRKIILRWIFRKLEGVVATGWRWLRIGTGGGLLWVR